MAVVPVLPAVTGGVYTTSQIAALIAAVAYLQAPPTAELRQIVAQSVTTATFTAVTFTAEDVDSANEHSTSANTSRLVATYAGWRQVSGTVGWAANATGRRISAWAVNGSFLNGGQAGNPTTAASDGEFVARTKHVYLNVGDYVELYAYQESGGALLTEVSATLQSTAAVRWVSN